MADVLDTRRRLRLCSPFAATLDLPDRSPSPRADTSVTDLAAALRDHSLASSARRQQQPPPHSSTTHDMPPIFTTPDYQAPSSSSAASSPVDSTYGGSTRSNSVVSSLSLPDPVCVPLRRSYSNTDVRRQRQRALRNQCSADHLQEISALVARMVAKGDQCNVCDSRPPVSATAVACASDPASDSGIDDDDYSDRCNDCDDDDDDACMDGSDARWGCEAGAVPSGRGRPPPAFPRHRSAFDFPIQGVCRVSKLPQMRKRPSSRK